MYDKELAREILNQTYHAAEKIIKRFEPVKSVDGELLVVRQKSPANINNLTRS